MTRIERGSTPSNEHINAVNGVAWLSGYDAPKPAFEHPSPKHEEQPHSHHAAVSPLATARRLVVKVGSAILVDQPSGVIRDRWLDTLIEDIVRYRSRGQDILIVSSGAVAIGRHAIYFDRRSPRIKERQAAAAMGQMCLTQAYWDAFSRHQMKAAQFLLTSDDIEVRQRHLNVRAALNQILTTNIVPVINENDAIAMPTASFGDNDRLAARVAQMVGSDMLVLLSDVDGLYSADPRQSPDAVLVREVREVTPEIERMASGAPTRYSSGGMVTKLAAARVALSAGCGMVIANGKHLHPLSTIEAGAPCSIFVPSPAARVARKAWIAASLRPAGAIVVDSNSAAALRQGGSLLPSGIVAIEDEFARRDAVIIREDGGNEFARGLPAFSSEELRLLAGRSSEQITGLFGEFGQGQLIHGDDLVITE